MPRTARLHELGLPFHVIVQGIERCPLFQDDFDRTGLLVRATRIFTEMGIDTLAWALMDNHAHFGLRANDAPLSKAMQRVLGSYAVGYNARHGRAGRLFRDRYWSRPVESEDDLLGLIGYIVLNPLRAGIVTDLASLRAYPWTSLHEMLTSPERRKALVRRGEVLSLFGPDTTSGLNGLFAMLAGQAAGGSEEFVRLEPGGIASLSERERRDLRWLSTHALQLRSERTDRILRERAEARALRIRLERLGWDLGRVIARAAEACAVSEERLRAGGRRRDESYARSLVAYFAGTYLAATDADIGRATGVTRQSVGAARTTLLRGTAPPMSWQEFFGLG